METTKRPQKTILPGSISPQTLRVHNNNHSWTLVPSCMACRVHGVSWLRYGLPEVTQM